MAARVFSSLRPQLFTTAFPHAVELALSHWRPFAAALRSALLIYGGLNAVMYSGLLPLWDGFDEPCHYGYVQWLRSTGSLPYLGRTPVPEEILR
jgi:hypothetical protein